MLDLGFRSFRVSDRYGIPPISRVFGMLNKPTAKETGNMAFMIFLNSCLWVGVNYGGGHGGVEF